MNGYGRILVGGLLSLALLYVTIAASFPSRAAVSQMIEVESPYVQDRNLILHRLDQIEGKIDRLLEQE
jgi:hypothetical protein